MTKGILTWEWATSEEQHQVGEATTILVRGHYPAKPGKLAKRRLPLFV